MSSLNSVAIPSGTTTLLAGDSRGTGDADLYVRRGEVPTTRSYRCRDFSGNRENYTSTIPLREARTTSTFAFTGLLRRREGDTHTLGRAVRECVISSIDWQSNPSSSRFFLVDDYEEIHSVHPTLRHAFPLAVRNNAVLSLSKMPTSPICPVPARGVPLSTFHTTTYCISTVPKVHLFPGFDLICERGHVFISVLCCTCSVR